MAPEEHLASMQRQLDRIEESQTRLTVAVIGDPDLGADGLVSRSKDHERRIKLLEKIVLIGTGAGALLSLIYGIAKDWLSPHTG